MFLENDQAAAGSVVASLRVLGGILLSIDSPAEKRNAPKQPQVPRGLIHTHWSICPRAQWQNASAEVSTIAVVWYPKQKVEQWYVTQEDIGH